MKLLNLNDLHEKGIRFSRQHIHKLVRMGKFPAPIKIGGNTNAWPDTEINQYLRTCISKRDSAAA